MGFPATALSTSAALICFLLISAVICRPSAGKPPRVPSYRPPYVPPWKGNSSTVEHFNITEVSTNPCTLKDASGAIVSSSPCPGCSLCQHGPMPYQLNGSKLAAFYCLRDLSVGYACRVEAAGVILFEKSCCQSCTAGPVTGTYQSFNATLYFCNDNLSLDGHQASGEGEEDSVEDKDSSEENEESDEKKEESDGEKKNSSEEEKKEDHDDKKEGKKSSERK